MLKYYDIINQMSDSEKIRLLCDIKCLSEKKYRVLGIPELELCDIDEQLRGEYPCAAALANTWDIDLIGNVANMQVKRAAIEGKGFIKVPSPRAKIDPYRNYICEDPWLASLISRKYLQSAADADVAAGLGDFGFYKDEPEWLDKKPDERFVYKFIKQPYMDAAKDIKCAAVLTEPDMSVKNYSSVNTELSNQLSKGEIIPGAYAICAHVSAEDTVSHLARGGLFFYGSALALESALSRYKKLSKDIKQGISTTEELNSELAQGSAISGETIDQALDRLLDFVFNVKRKPHLVPNEQTDEFAFRATAESVVLLKNQGSLLPLKSGAKVGYIGDYAFKSLNGGEGFVYELSALLGEQGYACSGHERGYVAELNRNGDMKQGAVALANSSDVVLLFLGMKDADVKGGYKIKQMALPANQQELLDYLAPTKAKIIAVVPAGVSIDIGIPEHCEAIISMPMDTPHSLRALADVVSGKINPSGKLASSMYVDSDELYTEYTTRRERDKMQVGEFIGYRYYTTSAVMPMFAFGHGLGYSKIAYSGVSCTEQTVKFDLKNNGKFAAMEVAQVYIGKEDSSVLRPRLELGGFVKVKLEPGEKKTVEVPIRIPTVYSAKHGKEIKESGAYTVYVGASCADIKLSQKIVIQGETLERDGKQMSDYVHSVSNIFTDNYKLEAKVRAMKKSMFNIVAGVVTLVLAIVLKLFCFANELYYGFFDWFVIALVATGISLFIAEAVRRTHLRAKEQKAIDAANKEQFKGAEQISVYSAEKMFVKEFDTEEQIVEREAIDQVEGIDTEYLKFIDKDVTFELAAHEFEEFAAQRGCKFRSDVTKKIFAALASSRLVVTSGMDNEEFKTFVKILSEYFEVPMFIDGVDDSYTSGEKVLFKTDAQGNKMKTNVHLAIDAAKKNSKSIHIAAMTDIVGSNLYTYFTPFVNFVKNPLADCRIIVLNERNVESSYYIPQNVWFILNLAQGETINKIPSFITDVATVNVFEYDACAVSAQTSQVHPFSYYQMDYLSERASNRITIDEDVWKRVDRLEEYANKYGEFHIGNKLWLCLEKYAHTFVACGGDQLSAFDEAVCAKLVVPVFCAVSDKMSDNDVDICDTFESILGEDHAYACKKALKTCAARRD